MHPSARPPIRFLLLPGWLDSGPQHWQSRWQHLYGDQRVEQDDWIWPRRGDWLARLDEVLLEDAHPSVLIAHSLGCHLAAAWTAHSRHTSRVTAALLVAPPDTDREDMPPNLYSWRPMTSERLPFPTTMISSDDDPFCAPETASKLAHRWGCRHITLGARGHLNADSGLGDWPEGRAELKALLGQIG